MLVEQRPLKHDKPCPAAVAPLRQQAHLDDAPAPGPRTRAAGLGGMAVLYAAEP